MKSKKKWTVAIMLVFALTFSTSFAYADNSNIDSESAEIVETSSNNEQCIATASGKNYQDTTSNTTVSKAVKMEMKGGNSISGKQNTQHNYFKFSLFDFFEKKCEN